MKDFSENVATLNQYQGLQIQESIDSIEHFSGEILAVIQTTVPETS